MYFMKLIMNGERDFVTANVGQFQSRVLKKNTVMPGIVTF